MKCFICIVSLLIALMAGNARAQIYADFKVSHGGTPLETFRVDLDYINAPRTCANFIGLATGQKPWLDTLTGKVVTGRGYYDGLKLHRLVHNFMIQGGDPQGNGRGGPGYAFQDEFHPSLRHSGRYKISMANSGPNSNGSQFFILLEPASGLDDKHSVFGEVINDPSYPNSRSVIDGFINAETFEVQLVDLSKPEHPDTNPKTSPVMPIVIESVMISGAGFASFNKEDPALLLPTVNGVGLDVAYSLQTSEYTQTFDRKNQGEYFAQNSIDLTSWSFFHGDDTAPTDETPYFMSMDSETNFSHTTSGVTGGRYFSRIVEIDYSLTPRAPENMLDSGKKFTLPMGATETVEITFDGSGGGTWLYSGGGSGSLTTLLWARHLNLNTGFEASEFNQGRSLPVGQLGVVFDLPVGAEKWTTLNFYNRNSSQNWYINFHTPTSGWCEGAILYEVTQPGGGTAIVGKQGRLPFTYTP